MRLILRIISKAIFIIVLALIVVFSINNNQIIEISLDPLPFEIEARLFIIILLAVFGGILIGFVCSSVALTKERFKNFINRWKIKILQRKVDKRKVNKKKDLVSE